MLESIESLLRRIDEKIINSEACCSASEKSLRQTKFLVVTTREAIAGSRALLAEIASKK